MAYNKYYPNGWLSGETGATPITAEALNHMEAGIAAAEETAGAALPRSGGTMTGPVTFCGIVLTEGVDYGTELPDPGIKGRLFFRII